MAIDTGSKSNRLLGSRRFTSTAIGTSQEAFSSVLDVNASEVYSQTHLIPTSSLPHSSSGQNFEYYQVNNENITRYWYRHRLTKQSGNADVWFFMYPTGSSTGVTPQLIQNGQQTNFISPKYSSPDLANNSTEDASPGYSVVVYKSDSTDSGSLNGVDDVIPGSEYQFDYKTGVLQLESAVDSDEIVYMTVYQYVGKTTRTGLDVDGGITGSFKGDGSGLTNIPASSIGGTLSQWTASDDGTYIHRFGEVRVSGSNHEQIIFKDGVIEATFSGALSSSEQISSDISGSWLGYLTGSNIYSHSTQELNSVTSSNDISASSGIYGDIYYSNNVAFARHSTDGEGVLRTAIGQAGHSTTLQGSSLKLVGQVTTSNDISSSATLFANHISASGDISASTIKSEFFEITSSVLITSESTEFGNSADDTHHFSGSITASGDISSSGNQYNNVLYNARGAIFNTDISDGSFLVKGSTDPFLFLANAGGNDKIQVGAVSPTSKFNVLGDITVTTNITASGTISADKFLGKFDGALSSSEQISSDISGSWLGYLTGSGIFSQSGDIATDISGSWLGYLTGSNIVSQSSQLGEEISGSFNIHSESFSSSIAELTDASHSFQNLITSNTGDISTLNTTLTTDSTSFESRIDLLEGSGTIQGVGTSNNVTFSHISSSGDIDVTSTGSFGRTEATTGKYSDLQVTDDLTVTDDVAIGGLLTATGGTVLGNSDTDIHQIKGLLDITGSFTASGEISASALITDSILIAGVDNKISFFDTNQYIQGNSTRIIIDGDNIVNIKADTRVNFDTPKVGINMGDTDTPGEELTVHGNISASGDLNITDITASGHISASSFIGKATQLDNTLNVVSSSAGSNFRDNADFIVKKQSGLYASTDNAGIFTEGSSSIGFTGSFFSVSNTIAPIIPAHGLFVSNSIVVGDSGQRGSAGNGILIKGDTDAPAIVGVTTNQGTYNSLGLRAQSGTQFFLATDGNVGIATDTPTEALSVVGNISASGNLTASGKAHIGGDTHIGGKLDVDGALTANSFTIGTFNFTNLTVNGSGSFASSITASGDISSSGTISANTYVGVVSESGQIASDISGSWLGYLTGSNIVSQSSQLGSSISGSWLGYLTGSNIVSQSSQLGSSISGSWLGYLTGSNIYSHSEQVLGSITSSGDISSSGTIFAKTIKGFSSDSIEAFKLDYNPTFGGILSLDDSDGTAYVAITHDFTSYINTGKNFGISEISPVSTLDVGGDLNVETNITASGNISSSKTLFANHISASGDISASKILTEFFEITSSVIITSESTEFGNSADDTHHFSGSITASGNISSSGIIFANNFSSNLQSSISGSWLGYLTGSNIVSQSSQLGSSISGSLGANADLIRSLTAVGISGSWLGYLTGSNIVSQSSQLGESISGSWLGYLTGSNIVSQSSQLGESISGSWLGYLTGSNIVSQSSQLGSSISGSWLGYLTGSNIVSQSSQLGESISGSWLGYLTGSNIVSQSSQLGSSISGSWLGYLTGSNIVSQSSQLGSSISGSWLGYLTGSNIYSHSEQVLGSITSSGDISATGDIISTKTIQMENSSSVVDTFNTSSHQTCKYLIQVTSASDPYSNIQSSEMLVMQSGSNAFNTEYAQINSGINLVNFSTDVDGSTVRLIASSSFISCSIKLNRTLI